MIEHCRLGDDALIYHPHLSNLYDCAIGAHSTVGPFVEIQRGVVIGERCKISSHTFICSGVTIGDRVFVAHGVMFTNDLYPAIDGLTVRRATVVEDDVAIGSGAVLLPVRIGRGTIIGAGTVVIDDAPPLAIMAGNPARVIRRFSCLEERNDYIECDHRVGVPG